MLGPHTSKLDQPSVEGLPWERESDAAWLTKMTNSREEGTFLDENFDLEVASNGTPQTDGQKNI